MNKIKSEKRISVRLDSEAASKLQNAKEKGYTSSQYINNLIKGSAVIDIAQYRALIPHLCELESLLEHEEDFEVKLAMREEIQKIWQYLSSFLETTGTVMP